MMRGQWTISNAISLLRILLLVPVSILLLQNDPSQRWFILTLMMVTASTDMLDGVLARRLNQVTELGKIMDPLADKIGITVVALILTFQQVIPFWFFMAAALRDILILIGGLYLRKKKNLTLSSNLTGKWTAGIMTLYLFFAFINIESLNDITKIVLIISISLIIISFTLYLIRFLKIIRTNK